MKRTIAIIVALAAILVAWNYGSFIESRRTADAERYADITARVWVASAIHRSDPDRYVAVRDSLLSASGVTRAELDQFVQKYEEEPEAYREFAQLASQYVDSLTAIELELLKQRADSLREADSVATAPTDQS